MKSLVLGRDLVDRRQSTAIKLNRPISFLSSTSLLWEQPLVCEFGNNLAQKFTLDGRALGQLNDRWAAGCDRHGDVYVLDTNNHRVQKVHL